MKRPRKVLLAVGLLLVLAPATGLAGGPPTPFVASGPILTIDAGDVTAAGKGGRFVVNAREVTGRLFGSIGGATGEPYTFTFGTNVPLMTQSGEIHGTLTAGGNEVRVHATSDIGVTPIPCVVAPPGTPCLGGYLPGLLLQGTFTFTAGAQGHGTATGWVIPAIDPTNGHIVGVLGGAIELTGQWQP